MDWIIAFVIIWSSLNGAAEEQAKAEALEHALAAQLELGMYEGNERAEAIIEANWSVMPEVADQGDAIMVRTSEAGELIWNEKTYTLQPFGNGYYALLPIAIDMKPGEYPIGGKKVTVRAKSFETDRLTVTRQQEDMKRNWERINADQLRINQARSTSAAEFLYDEEFIQPIEGKLTTPYGYTRYVNGEYDGSHTAIDLAAPTGTPVKAANSGIVVLADELYLTGNSIYIDHGMNLFSQYAHMSELKVQTGDVVKKGDIIGLVGTTGFSTGPHLHFTFWIGNTPVNPNLFFDRTPFLWGTPSTNE